MKKMDLHSLCILIFIVCRINYIYSWPIRLTAVQSLKLVALQKLVQCVPPPYHIDQILRRYFTQNRAFMSKAFLRLQKMFMASADFRTPWRCFKTTLEGRHSKVCKDHTWTLWDSERLQIQVTFGGLVTLNYCIPSGSLGFGDVLCLTGT